MEANANANGSTPLLRPAARADQLQARQAICTLACTCERPCGTRAAFLLLLRQTSAGGDTPPPRWKPLVNHQPSLFASKLLDASSSTLHCCGNQNASLKFVPLILRRGCAASRDAALRPSADGLLGGRRANRLRGAGWLLETRPFVQTRLHITMRDSSDPDLSRSAVVLRLVGASSWRRLAFVFFRLFCFDVLPQTRLEER